MIDTFFEVFSHLDTQVFLSSILLFFIGYALAPTVYFKDIKWLKAYPMFMFRLIEKYFREDPNKYLLFTVILVLNSISLLVNLFSAYGIILPFIFSVWMGLNVGVVMYHTLNGRLYFMSLLNPVAMLELPAAWITFTLAMQFSLNNYFHMEGLEMIGISSMLYYFLVTVLPILFLAGIIETGMIVLAERFGEDEDDSDN
jgi:hypothetical protein